MAVRTGPEGSPERGEQEHRFIDHREVHPILDLGPPTTGHDEIGLPQRAQVTRCTGDVGTVSGSPCW